MKLCRCALRAALVLFPPFMSPKVNWGKERPRTKPCHFPWLVNSLSLMCAMLWQAEQGEGEVFSASEQRNKVPPYSADSHFSEGLS